MDILKGLKPCTRCGVDMLSPPVDDWEIDEPTCCLCMARYDFDQQSYDRFRPPRNYESDAEWVFRFQPIVRHDIDREQYAHWLRRLERVGDFVDRFATIRAGRAGYYVPAMLGEPGQVGGNVPLR